MAVDRGGGLTWHGPGQVVGYPVVKWGDREEASVADIIHIIEGWLIETLATFGVVGVRDERMQGVWVNGRKVCSIGLSFLRWVSRHGFSVNLNTPVGRVEGVAGCGLAADTTTSLRPRPRHPSRDFVRPCFPSCTARWGRRAKIGDRLPVAPWIYTRHRM